MTTDIVCNFGYIGVVQGRIDLIQYEKWCWLIAACELLKLGINVKNKKLRTYGWQRAMPRQQLFFLLPKVVPCP
jgi:hypothetical protein